MQTDAKDANRRRRTRFEWLLVELVSFFFFFSLLLSKVCVGEQMFGLFYGLWQYLFKKAEFYVVILGLDAAGKTVRSIK
jgi:hypothetical protein